MANRLSRDAILKIEDQIYEDVEVPEWGGTVRIKALTAAERDQYEALVFLDPKGEPAKRREDIRAKLVVFSAVDESGTRLFGEKDIAQLSARSARAMNRLWAVASRLSGIGGEDQKELEKN